MALWDFLSGLLDPVAKTVDTLHTSKEEKQILKNELTKIQNQLTERVLEYEKELLKSRTEIISAEARGESWLQRNWRPILMLAVVAILVNNYLIYPYLTLWTDKAQILELPGGLWTLLTTGVTGYIVGRSGEKIAHDIKDGRWNKPQV